MPTPVRRLDVGGFPRGLTRSLSLQVRFPQAPIQAVRIAASKEKLFDFCSLAEIPCAQTEVLTGEHDILELIRSATFPLVIKIAEPWKLLDPSAIRSTTIIRDSAQLLALTPAARRWVDLGSGAGFPGLVIAILLAERPVDGSRGAPGVTLIESHGRKCAFLREVARQTGLAEAHRVEILLTRIENAATQSNLRGPDVVSARALARSPSIR